MKIIRISRLFSSFQRYAYCYQTIVLLTAFLFTTREDSLAQSAFDSFGSLASWDGKYATTGVTDSGLTVGETFQINSGNALVTSIEFPLFNNGPIYSPPGPTHFQAGVFAWNGSKPTGSLLYLSDLLIGYGSEWQNFVITPNNLMLNQGQQYILFFTGINYLSGVQSVASMGAVPTSSYTDGQFYISSLGLNDGGVGINNLLIDNWTGIAADMAFQVNYQIVPVPEPPANVLFGLGLVLFITLYKHSLKSNRPSQVASLCEYSGQVSFGDEKVV